MSERFALLSSDKVTDGIHSLRENRRIAYRMKKSRIMTALLSVGIFILVGSVAVCAYFSLRGEQEEGIGIDPETSLVEVSDFEELFRATQVSSYNDSSPYTGTDGRNRVTVRLLADISLPINLEITADVHLDLGGYQLSLDGHTLTFRHSYHGTVVLSNGRILLGEGGAGAVLADIPNAALLLDGVNIGVWSKMGEWEEVAGKLQVISFSPEFVAYHFFRTVAAAVADESTTLREVLPYPSVEGRTGFSASDFIVLYRADDCSQHRGQPCSYIFADMDLPASYLGYPDIVVSYTTDGVLTADGGIAGYGNDVIVATLTIGEETFTCDFPVHVPELSENQRPSVVLEMVKRYLSRYWVEEASDGGTTTLVQQYQINHDCYLPARFSFCDGEVSYVAYDGENNVTVEVSATEEEAYVLFAPTLSTVMLTASVSGQSLSFSMSSSNVATVKSAVTVANDLMKKWYGTEITVTVDSNNVYTYTGNAESGLEGYLPLYGLDHYTGTDYEKAYPGIRSIGYSVVYGDTVEEYYTVEDASEGEDHQKFYVSSGKHPENDAGSVYLNVEMTVWYNGSLADVVIQIPVRCYLAGDESGLSRFLPYYSVFDKSISEQAEGYNLEDINMPFNYRKGLPVVCYALSATDGYDSTLRSLQEAVMIYFVDKDGKEHRLDGKWETAEVAGGEEGATRTVVSFTDALEAILTTSDALREQAESGKAHYTLRVDTSVLGVTDLELSLTYQFLLSYGATSWTTYNLVSGMTIPGVLPFGSLVSDANFYTWIYNHFNPSGKTISSATEGMILTDWLTGNVTLDYKNDTELQQVTDFTGLSYLIGTQKLLLSGASVTASNIREIAAMRSLITIDLSGCGISVAAGEDSPFLAWGASNSQLSNLVSVDLRDNAIYEFDFLEALSQKSRTLARIVLSGNVPGTTDADHVFYGSDGLGNYGTYRELVAQGIAVYSGGSADSPVLFADSRSSSRVYRNLCNIEYQNKLPAGVDLSTVLSELSTSASDYGLGTSAANTAYSCTVSGVTISYRVVDDTTFALVYTATANAQTYQIVLKFSVRRV